MPYPVFFGHANGFSARTYDFFLRQLACESLDYIDRLGHGAYDPRKGWARSLTREIIDHLDQRQQEPVVAIGHSLGGVLCFFAARQRPDLFRAVIMLDSPIFHPSKRLVLSLARLTGLMRYLPPASKARNRRTHFSSREEAHAYFAAKSLFRNFHPRCLDDYILYGLQPSAQGAGYELSFSAQVEFQIFYHVPYLLGPKRLEVPSYFVHSNSKEVLDSGDLGWLKRAFHTTRFLSAEGGHMFPLERPGESAAMLNSLMQSL